MGLEEVIIGRRNFLFGSLVAAASSAFPYIAEAQKRNKTKFAAKASGSVRQPQVQMPKISDYEITSHHLVPLRKSTPKRKETDYIILHMTEGYFKPSLYKLRMNAEANFIIDRNGKVYELVRRDYRAHHAGVSLWDGKYDVSSRSVGIELVDNYGQELTDAQYRSLKPLVRDLRRQYKIPEQNVLGHFQVAFSEEAGFRFRGRKYDGYNIDWQRIGINHRTDDPDEISGLIKFPEPFLKEILQREEERKLRLASLDTTF